MDWAVQEDGVYEASLTPTEDGLYQVSVTASSDKLPSEGGQNSAAAQTYFLTQTGSREYFDAVQKKDFLTQLSEETGGRYYRLADVDRLPEEIVYSEAESASVEILPLWNMPINFLLLAGLLFGEWILRKRRGLI